MLQWKSHIPWLLLLHLQAPARPAPFISIRTLILTSSCPFSGTGKTRTLLSLAEVLVRTSAKTPSRWSKMGPVLACADTNAAVDNLVEGLLARGLTVVRVGE